MSLERPVELNCPECQNQQTVIVWDSLNADVSPEAREELFQGRINVFECDACGQTFPIAAPLLYHDMTRRFLVQFYPFEAFDNAFLERFDDNGNDSRFVDTCGVMNLNTGDCDLFYMRNPHIVFQMSELVRYVLFRERLFDSRARRAEIGRFFVAGFHHHHGPQLIDQLEVGKELRLVREPDNLHDPRAVAIHYHDDRIGYVPRERNREIADLLDQGALLTCRITAVDPEEGAFDAVEVLVANSAIETRTTASDRKHRLPGGREIFLVRLAVEATYGGCLEGTPESNTAFILENLPGRAALLMPPASPLAVIRPTELRLPRWMCVAHLDSSQGAGTSEPDYHSRLYVCWFVNRTDQCIDSLVDGVLPEIDWDRNAEDYDWAFI